MVTYSDVEYKLTKLIKQGKTAIDEDFKLLKDWIDRTYDVHTMNIIYDTIDNTQKTPRLQIIFEYENDREKFRNNPQDHFNYDSEKQCAIINQFERLSSNRNLPKKAGLFNFFRRNKPKYKADGLFVAFSAFEPIATEEAYSHVARKQLNELKERISNNGLWDIITSFSCFIIFFYTEKQVEENMNSSLRKELTHLCFGLVKQYDEFGYLNKETYSVSLDSKENFDNNYDSNWYYYFK
jgi:hypothetical protein